MLPRSSWAGVRSPARWSVSFRLTSRGGRTTVSEALSTRRRHRSLNDEPEQVARVDADHAAVGDDQHVVAVRMGGGDAVDGARARARHTASSGSPPGGGQSWGARSHARYGSPSSRRISSTVQPSHSPSESSRSSSTGDQRHVAAAQGDLRRLRRAAERAHVGGPRRGRSARPSASAWARPRADSPMSVEPWKRRSAFQTDSPWRASSSLTPTAPRPRPARAESRQHLVAPEQGQDVEERRRRRAARSRPGA